MPPRQSSWNRRNTPLYGIGGTLFCFFLQRLCPPPHRRDLCTTFGKDVAKLVEVRPLINDLLTEGRRSKTTKTKTLATWATKELRKLKSQAWSVDTLGSTHTADALHCSPAAAH